MTGSGLLKVEPPYDGTRLDTFLASVLGHSRSGIKKWIDSGMVKVDGSVRTAHYKVSSGQSVTYKNDDAGRNTGRAEDIEFGVIYECADYIIINKPAGLVVHPAPSVPSGTLLNGLFARYGDPHLVHRLDKDTSGIMVAALNESTALDLRRQFKDREVKKAYKAIASGLLRDMKGMIDVPIRRSRRDPTKMDTGWSRARQSVTEYQVVEMLKDATLVDVFPLSGRTHQIRVHFSYIGHPLLGDSKYADSEKGASRQMLHAWRLSFIEHASGERVYYEVDPPDDFKKTVGKLKLQI